MPQEVYNLAAQSHVAVSYKEPELTAAVSGLVSRTDVACSCMLLLSIYVARLP